MKRRRKFNRWHLEKGEKILITFPDREEEVNLLDVSTGGMKISSSNPVEVGSIIYSKFKVLPNLPPFFVRGKVVRLQEKGGSWEIAVEFEKVSTLPWKEVLLNRRG
ncbi:MAG: hypothetical protein B6D56_04130 [Candidatus Omnitrophica bacterium 4484_70.1]|nr:MAG: hypothetical protein B6D56_04130 [Candidatus Omnitrophica bacterium 4484_70.1]